MWKEVEHVILAPEKVIDEIVDVFLLIFHRPLQPKELAYFLLKNMFLGWVGSVPSVFQS